MNYKVKLISYLLLFSFLLSACSPSATEVKIPTFKEVESTVLDGLDVEKIYSTIEELTTEPRVAGTVSEKNAANFLTGQLEGFGYKVGVQKFNFDKYIFPEVVTLTVDEFDESFTPAPFEFSVSGKVTGELISAGTGLKSDYENIDAKGKIALVSISEIYFSEIVLNAAEAGAVGVIICFSKELATDGWTLGDHDEDFIPAVALSADEGKALLDLLNKHNSIKVTLTIDGSELQTNESQNIVVKKPSAVKSNDVVIIGAHYDSVEGAPGASDNASGTAVILEIARVLQAIPLSTEIHFLFFGAEEIGLKGSEKYVSEMTKNEINQTVAMFNLDMVGSADAGPLTVFTVDNWSNTVTELASEASRNLFQEDLPLEFTDRSDHTPFHYAGIDAAAFSYFPLEEWYHSPKDGIDNISKERLDDVAKLIAKSVLELSYQDN